ncbi:helix-turn-helix transcriptional regulator [Actinoplanes sp. Pm04-4]|uniref:Helix-turn-helix transcriptional regulator n=1 Tax=Paractinoplanes pyxinae TaxID=2997416 RepID=A0ABT4B4D4_9ACTN|nr:helix-turn-helix transcriptional regulator [Actinoplanes pyxinae]MCY1141346.1 helix-turn-helix transcriptional regulator [Actinoplanes pyxinae]
MPEHDHEGFVLRLDRFDELTAQKGWMTDQQKAAGVGVSHTTLGRIRRGLSQPGARFIANTTNALGVAVEDLFTQPEVTRG